MARTLSDEEAARIAARSDPVRVFLCGLLWGAAIGAAVGVLYAPKKGSETRKILRAKARDVQKLVQYEAEDIKERALEVADDIKTKAEEIRKRGEEELKSLRDKA
jgi:gas vesicle protein